MRAPNSINNFQESLDPVLGERRGREEEKCSREGEGAPGRGRGLHLCSTPPAIGGALSIPGQPRKLTVSTCGSSSKRLDSPCNCE